MRLIFTTLCLCTFAFIVKSQNLNHILIPPSPEASSISKYGEFPVSNFTGTPSIEIPLYQINVGRIKVPIKLKYHSSGIKVEEVPSRVGLGWSLDAGGVVSRSMVGYPDDHYFQDLAPDAPEQYGYFMDNVFSGYDPYSYPLSYDAGPDLHFYSFPVS